MLVMKTTKLNEMKAASRSVLDQVLPGVISDELTKKCLHPISFREQCRGDARGNQDGMGGLCINNSRNSEHSRRVRLRGHDRCVVYGAVRKRRKSIGLPVKLEGLGPGAYATR